MSYLRPGDSALRGQTPRGQTAWAVGRCRGEPWCPALLRGAQSPDQLLPSGVRWPLCSGPGAGQLRPASAPWAAVPFQLWPAARAELGAAGRHSPAAQARVRLAALGFTSFVRDGGVPFSSLLIVGCFSMLSPPAWETPRHTPRASSLQRGVGSVLSERGFRGSDPSLQ